MPTQPLPCSRCLPVCLPGQVRVESTITESNGSSSMASVCGGCLAMLDAGAWSGVGAIEGGSTHRCETDCHAMQLCRLCKPKPCRLCKPTHPSTDLPPLEPSPNPPPLPGVPLKQPVAGIAMGLILEPSGAFQVLTDILGSEDALGDMDFKVG